MKLSIRVTQDDIKNGVPGSPYSCPVARAIRRVANRKSVAVGVSYCRINHIRYGFPEMVADNISRYDLGYAMRPFSFKLVGPLSQEQI